MVWVWVPHFWETPIHPLPGSWNQCSLKFLGACPCWPTIGDQFPSLLEHKGLIWGHRRILEVTGGCRWKQTNPNWLVTLSRILLAYRVHKWVNQPGNTEQTLIVPPCQVVSGFSGARKPGPSGRAWVRPNITQYIDMMPYKEMMVVLEVNVICPLKWSGSTSGSAPGFRGFTVAQTDARTQTPCHGNAKWFHPSKRHFESFVRFYTNYTQYSTLDWTSACLRRSQISGTETALTVNLHRRNDTSLCWWWKTR